MSTPMSQRITTADPNEAKRLRVIGALSDSKYRALSNRAIAKKLHVDEATVRRYRKVCPAAAVKRNAAGKKGRKKP